MSTVYIAAQALDVLDGPYTPAWLADHYDPVAECTEVDAIVAVDFESYAEGTTNAVRDEENDYYTALDAIEARNELVSMALVGDLAYSLEDIGWETVAYDPTSGKLYVRASGYITYESLLATGVLVEQDAEQEDAEEERPS